MSELSSWKELELRYTRPLTSREIVETFPAEARELAPKRLALMEGALRAYYGEYIAPAVQRARPEDRPILELLVTTLWPNCEVVSELTRRIRHLQGIIAELKRRQDQKTKKGRPNPDAIEKARRHSLANLCNRYGVTLRREGPRLRGHCPFHEDHEPSFVVYPDNRWYCFGCGANGDSINFVMRMEGITFVEALRRLAG